MGCRHASLRGGLIRQRLAKSPLSGGNELRSGKTPYSLLAANLKIEQGTINVDDVHIEGPSLRLGLAGSASIPARELDLTGFDPKAKPPRTEGFDALVAAAADPRDAPLVDLIEKMGRPAALTLGDVRAAGEAVALYDQDGEMLATFTHAAKRKHASLLLAAVGYVPVSNRAAKDGLWKVDGKRQVIYGLAKSTPAGRVSAALRRVEGMR